MKKQTDALKTRLEIEVDAEKRRQPILTLCPRPLDRLFLPFVLLSEHPSPFPCLTCLATRMRLPVSGGNGQSNGNPSPRYRFPPLVPSFVSRRTFIRGSCLASTAFPSQLRTMIFHQVGRRSKTIRRFKFLSRFVGRLELLLDRN